MRKILLGALALVALPSSANAAAFVNGGFESGVAIGSTGFNTLTNGSTAITGWTVTGDSIDYVGNYWQAGEGSRSIDLSGVGPGGIMQTFDTIVGVTYNVRFLLAGNPDGGPTTKVMSTVASGNLPQISSFNIANSTRSDMKWVPVTYSFVAGADTTTLAFTSGTQTAFGAALDGVSVTAVPEPATWAMMLFGFGAIGGVLRRSRKTGSARAYA
ncbi:choice-of-anchor C family protein [Sphingomonas floccifaciens]|uniref:Choice-of-anchor C family protein n=1 Tax=Sphingomonas floccifaciens TaxID=1844115 RepID=A0ABW4N7L9_9SPHN